MSSDYLVYNHFKKIFERKLEQFGKEKMEKELNMLEEANSNIRVSASNSNFFFFKHCFRRYVHCKKLTMKMWWEKTNCGG